MANTFDTSRVGGGTYELEQDANGNYKLKSVGFTQVNKLNLPDLATSDTTTTTPKKEEEKKIEVADPFLKLGTQNTGGGESGQGGGQDYSGVMLKTPEVKDAEVRSAAEPMTKERLTESFAGEEKPTQTYADQLKQSQANVELGLEPQTQYRSDSAKFKERFDPTKIQAAPERTTGLQKPISKAKALGTDAISKTKKIIGTVAKMLIPGANILSMVMPERTATQQVNVDHFNVRDDGRIAGNPATDLYAGMNRNSAFGNLETAGAKRIARREKTAATKNVSDKFKADTEKMKEQLNDYREGKAQDRDNRMGNTKTNVTGFGKTGLGRDTDYMGQGGGGSSGGGGKIVCTMMNESYGFGSFRNKIWLRHSKNLAPEYQIGYHRIFLPLVKKAKTNKILKKILEHIAVHRTIDIRQQERNKIHLIGRVYRTILEPICYWAGKK